MIEVTVYLSGSHVTWFRMLACPRAGETITLTGEHAKEILKVRGAKSFRVERVEHEVAVPANDEDETVHAVNVHVARL